MVRSSVRKIVSVAALVGLWSCAIGVCSDGYSLRPDALRLPPSGMPGLGEAGIRYAMSRVPQDCPDPARSSNPDIRRHLAAIRSAGLCYRRDVVDEGRFRWTFHVFHHPQERDGPFWLLPHDDENTAFEAAIYAVSRYGGGFLAIDSGQRRRFRGQDPNRNFGRTWGESALCREQARPAPAFTAAVMTHFAAHRKYPYLALHNNRDGWFGNGGTGTISVYRTNSVLRGLPSAKATGALRDEDNLVYIAGVDPYASDTSVQGRVKALNRLGLNVVHRHVTSASFNCSFSDYVARNGLGDYYNIETQEGRPAVQKQMVDRLMKHLGRRPVGGPSWDSSPFVGGVVPIPAAGV